MPSPLSDAQIHAALKNLPGWTCEAGQLHCRLEFGSFREAVSFMVRLAFEAERLNHHPDLRNVYNRVDLTLSTHDAGGKATQKDLQLARAIHQFNWVQPK